VLLRSDSAQSRHDISVIAAPVYDHHQRQIMVATLQIGSALSNDEITAHARGLVTAADALTGQLGGSKPAHRRTGM
ncbi:MAG: ArsR family transcriptional regulator, partial [Mycobacterium sp.]|nr:ArsR family transcriptional regulator [Mycobacterium sp.]